MSGLGGVFWCVDLMLLSHSRKQSPEFLLIVMMTVMTIITSNTLKHLM